MRHRTARLVAAGTLYVLAGCARSNDSTTNGSDLPVVQPSERHADLTVLEFRVAGLAWLDDTSVVVLDRVAIAAARAKGGGGG